MYRLFYYPLFLLVLLSSSFSGIAQDNCGIASSLWKDYRQFIPTEESPVFTMRVNFIVPQRSDGTANFTSEDDEAMKMFHSWIKGANNLWSTLKEPKDADCYTGDDFLDDSHIRFQLNEIVFIQDDHFWNGENGSGCPNDRNWYLNPLDDEIRKNPAYENAINIYLPNMEAAYKALVVDKSSIEHPKAPPPCSELPSYRKLSRSSRINLAGTYNKYYWMQYVFPADSASNTEGYAWNPVIYGWMEHSTAHTIAHELGHSMGLSHANEHHGRNKCDESIMHQGHGQPHNYLQPTELGKIHRNLRMSNIREFIVNDPYSPVPFIIDEDTEFTMDYKSYEDIIVRAGSTFHVHCALSMHEDTRIIVEPGASLLVQAVISTRGESETTPIIVRQKERWRLFGNKNRKIGRIEMTAECQLDGATLIKKVKRKKS